MKSKQKQMTANNLDNVSKALTDMGAGELIKDLDPNIPEVEKWTYHVVFVKITPLSGSVKNDVSILQVKYHKHGYYKAQNNITGLFDKMLLLHNPEELKEDREVTLPDYEVQRSEDEIRKELEEEYERKYQKRLEQDLEKKRNRISFKDKVELDITGLFDPKVKVEELREFARLNSLPLKGAKTKEEIQEALKDAVSEYNENVKLANELV